MKEIKLTQGKVALVDDEDFEELNKFKWCARKDRNTYYAVRRNKELKIGNIQMHREILKVKDKTLLVDHRDHDGLNNQKNNLRVATAAGNSKNRQSRKGSASKYLGVYWAVNNNKWLASIRNNGKNIYLGYFINELDAAIAYNIAAVEIHGEFANLNIITEF